MRVWRRLSFKTKPVLAQFHQKPYPELLSGLLLRHTQKWQRGRLTPSVQPLLLRLDLHGWPQPHGRLRLPTLTSLGQIDDWESASSLFQSLEGEGVPLRALPARASAPQEKTGGGSGLYIVIPTKEGFAGASSGHALRRSRDEARQISTTPRYPLLDRRFTRCAVSTICSFSSAFSKHSTVL